MHESLTPEYIKADMLEDFTLADTREGSYTNSLVSPVAYEFWKSYQELDSAILKFYIDQTSGKYIDAQASWYGITRKTGAKATAVMRYTGADGAIIAKGKVFQTADSLQFITDAEVVISGGTATGTVTALDIGEAYNVAVGAITRQLVNLSGLTGVTNDASTGGADAETDAALFARLDDFRKRPATSGNAAHYRQWALEVDGIGGVRVMPTWNGPATVKVLLVGPDNEPVDDTIVANVAAHIEDERPIGADVTVMSAAALDINVSASVKISSSTTVETVQVEFSDALRSYLQGIAFTDYLVVYNRIGYILLDIDGVVDFTALTVNGGTADITVAEDAVPVTGEIEVTI